MSARKLRMLICWRSKARGNVSVDLEALVERAAIAGRNEMHRQSPGFDWQKIARRILALVEKEAARG